MKAVRCTDPEAGRYLSRCCRSKGGAELFSVFITDHGSMALSHIESGSAIKQGTDLYLCCLLVVISKADLKKLLIEVALVLLRLTWGK